jgi:uncharacterized membrane protein YqiK
MGLILIPLILLLAGIGIFVLLIFIIARQIDSKRKETFEKRDY